MNKPKIIALLILLFLGFLVRLHKFDEPIADWHSFRQSDTAAVAKIYSREGYDLLYPKYFDISNVQSGFNNPEGYRFVEFPVYNALHAFAFENFGMLSFPEWGRIINIVASLVTALVIFLLVRKHFNEKAALFSLVAFLFLPFSIFYSRTILPDIMMTTSILLGIYFFDKYLEKRKEINKRIWFYFLALFFTALSFLLKPFAIFFVIPIIYLAFRKYGEKTFLQWPLWIFAILSIVPISLWRYWISQFPEGIPASQWLFNGDNIRFRPAFFRWIFFERVTKLILGYAGIIFLISSIFSFKNKNILFFLSFALSSLLYLFIVATGNVRHDYYQIIIIPTIAMFVGIGAYEIYNFASKKLDKISAGIVIGIIFVSAFYFSWVQVKDFFNINDRAMVKAGNRADEILPEDAVVIAPYDGSTTFLNTVSRKGWPVFQESIGELIDKGATHLVIASPTESDFSGFGSQYEIIDSSENYLIIKLK